MNLFGVGVGCRASGSGLRVQGLGKILSIRFLGFGAQDLERVPVHKVPRLDLLRGSRTCSFVMRVYISYLSKEA